MGRKGDEGIRRRIKIDHLLKDTDWRLTDGLSE